MVREGDFYFQNNIKFFQGGVAPLHPHGEGNERENFTFGYSELLRATPPVAERRQPPQRGGQPPPLGEVSRQWRDGRGFGGRVDESCKKRGFALAKWEFCKLPSGSCRVSCTKCNLTRAHPPAPSRAYTFFEEGTTLAREGETILYISFQRGISSPFETPRWREEAGENNIPFW